jgi:hypothetical protein
MPDPELLAEALGSEPHSWTPVNTGGYTRSRAFRVVTADGLVFAKEADDDGSLHMLRREAIVYRNVRGPFLPAFVGFADSGEARSARDRVPRRRTLAPSLPR